MAEMLAHMRVHARLMIEQEDVDMLYRATASLWLAW